MRWEVWGPSARVKVFLYWEGIWKISDQRIYCDRLNIATNSLISLPWRARVYIPSPWIWVSSVICFGQQNMVEVMLCQLLSPGWIYWQPPLTFSWNTVSGSPEPSTTLMPCWRDSCVSILVDSPGQDQASSLDTKFVNETILESPNQLICQLSIPSDLSWLQVEQREHPADPYSNY